MLGEIACRIGEASSFGCSVVVWQPGDAMPLKTPMLGAPGELRNTLPEAAQRIVERLQNSSPELGDHRLLGR